MKAQPVRGEWASASMGQGGVPGATFHRARAHPLLARAQRAQGVSHACEEGRSTEEKEEEEVEGAFSSHAARSKRGAR